MGLRRKTVVGHWRDAGHARARSAAGRGRPAAGARPRRLRVARFGDNMRDVAVTEGDKVEAQLRLGVCGRRVRGRRSRSTRSTRADRRRSTSCRRLRGALRARAPSSAPAARAARSLLDAARIEAGLRGVPRRGRRSARSPTPSRTCTACAQLPGIAAAAADGRRLRLRRRGRLEDRGARADPQGDGGRAGRRHVVHGGLHLRPRARASRSCWARTCSRSARRSPRAPRPARSTRSRSAVARIRCASCSTPRPGRRSSSRCSTSASGFRLLVNEVDVVAPPHPLPKLPVARALWRPLPDFATAAEAWLAAGGPHHTVLLRRARRRDARRLRGDRRDRAAGDRRATRRMRQFRNELRWNDAYHRIAPGSVIYRAPVKLR